MTLALSRYPLADGGVTAVEYTDPGTRQPMKAEAMVGDALDPATL